MLADELVFSNGSGSPLKQALKGSQISADYNMNSGCVGGKDAIETQSNDTKYFNKSKNQSFYGEDAKDNLLNTTSRGDNELNSVDISDRSPVH